MYYAEYYVGRKKKKVPLASDKSVAQVKLGELIRNLEKGTVGLIDPFKEHRKQPLLEHVAEYLATLERGSRTAR